MKTIRIICDTREPWPHPWEQLLPDGVFLIREKLETGDFALYAMPVGAVIERKTAADMAGCLTTGRERFEKELRRSRQLGAFAVVIEADLADVIRAARGMATSAVLGTIAAWTRRYCPFVFAGSTAAAADFSVRFLLGQIRDHERVTGDIAKAEKKEVIAECRPANQNAAAGILTR